MSRPTTDMVRWKEWEKLTLTADSMGHVLSVPEEDTEVSLVGECLECGDLFAVDGQEPPYRFGRTIESQCEALAAGMAAV